MDISLILDAIVAVLLITTIGYAVVLNRRLGALRNAKSEIEALIAQFAESTDKAGSGIESLKDETRRSGEALQGKLDAARGLVDDLAFLLERGSSLADRLDGAVGAARAKIATGGASKRAHGARHPGRQGSVTPVGAEGKPGDNANTPAGAESGPGDTASSGALPDRPGPDSGARDLSAQESELLKALQGMR
ncbi:MAG: hypothetical protein IH924_00215 [Proteobacteria bacterium]|nr:hypothetical protein [Pseudomonadota bacterium]